MSFDEEPDAPLHGECAAEIAALTAECERLKADLRSCKTNAYAMFIECGTARQCAERAEAELAALRLDAERLDWIAARISGREWSAIGVVYSEIGEIRSAIDAARQL